MERVLISLILSVFLIISAAWAEEKKEAEKKEAKLEEIVVTGEPLFAPTKEATETVYTGVEITTKGIELGGEKGSSNVWSILNILPGIVFEPTDPANLSSTQSTIRVRGVSGSLGTMSIEGIPIYGGNPIGPRAYIIDSENFESIGVYKGNVPVELGTGAGTRGGTLELKPKWAKDNFGLELKQSLGSFEYLKSFVRIDSGQITPYGTKFSLSYSYTEEDKWRGLGKVGPRNNFNLTLIQPLGDLLNLKLWVNKNDISHHKYRSLSYQEAIDLAKYRRWDYNKDFTGDPNTDWQYYDYYTLEWKNFDSFLFIDFKLTDGLLLQLKPYYREEEKEDWSGSSRVSGPTGTKAGVTFSGWTTKRYGLISQLVFTHRLFQGMVGYHYQASKWLDSVQRNYWLNPDGSLTFVGWGRFTESKGSSPIHSPFLKLAGTIDKLNWQIGVKYLETKDNLNEGYITKYSDGKPYLDREPLLDYGGRKYSAWVPSFGLSYNLIPTVEIYTSAGRTFQTPYMYMPLVNLYYNLYSKFKKLGITLDDLFKEFRPEETNNIDFGLRIKTDKLEFYPTVYYSKHKNLNTPITPNWKDPDDPTKLLLDPTTNRPVSYNTFIGKAKGYGFELGTTYHITKDFSVFLNPSIIRLEYDGNITHQGTTYNVDGKQVVNVPKKMLVTGIIGRLKDLEIVPMLRYIGKTYGNLAFTEKILSYSVVDLKLTYSFGEIKSLKMKDLRASLEFYNLFDKKYFISGYNPGIPLTVFSSLSFKF